MNSERTMTPSKHWFSFTDGASLHSKLHLIITLHALLLLSELSLKPFSASKRHFTFLPFSFCHPLPQSLISKDSPSKQVFTASHLFPVPLVFKNKHLQARYSIVSASAPVIYPKCHQSTKNSLRILEIWKSK